MKHEPYTTPTVLVHVLLPEGVLCLSANAGGLPIEDEDSYLTQTTAFPSDNL